MRAEATVSDLCGRLPAETMMTLGVTADELGLPAGMQGRLGAAVIAFVEPSSLSLPSGMRGQVEVPRLRAA